MDSLSALVLAVTLLLAPLSCCWQNSWLAALLDLLPLAALCLLLWRKRFSVSEPLYPPGSCAILVFIGWGFMQLIPLPPVLVKLLSPEAWKIYQQSAALLAPSDWISLSLNPRGTLQTVLALCGACACYFLAFSLLQERSRLKQAALWLTGIAGGLSMGVVLLRALSLLASAIAAEPKLTLLLSQNLFAAASLLILLGPLALASLLAFRPSARYGSLQERLVTYWQATVREHFLIVALSSLVIPFGLALLYWQSSIFYLAAIGLLWLLLLLKGKGRREALYLTVSMLLLLVAVIVGHTADATSVAAKKALQSPQAGPTIARRLVGDFFLTGSGLGTYEKVFDRYDRINQEPTFANDSFAPLMWARAEAGCMFLLASLWFLISVLRSVWPRWRMRRNKLSIYLFAGSLCGLAGFITSSVLLGMPVPNWLWYYGFVSVGLLACSSQASRPAPPDDGFTPPVRDGRCTAGRMLISCVLLMAVLFHGGSGMARWLAGEPFPEDLQAGEGAASSRARVRILGHAVFYDPLNAEYRWGLAKGLLQLGRPPEALRSFASALRLAPLSGAEAYALGLYLEDLGHQEQARQLMKHALQNDWDNQAIQTDFVSRLLQNGETTEALEHLRQILTFAPLQTSDWLYFLDLQGVPVDDGATILADHPSCLTAYGDFLLYKERPELAMQNYQAALHLIQSMDTFSPQTILHIAAYFESVQLHEEALTAVLKGLNVYPEDLDILKATARLYRSVGLTFKAMATYRKILLHFPQDLEARQQLELLESLRH